MITCAEAVRNLWEYLDGAVREEDRQAIQEHLNVCKRCCGEAEFATELRQFLENHAQDELPRETRARLTAFLDQL